MKNEVFRQAASGFAAVDVSEESAMIAEIDAKIAVAQKGIETAEDRCSEIARLKQGLKGPQGADVAAALLDGASATDAARAGPSIESLEEERLSLRAGIKALGHQIEDLRAEIGNIESSARAKIGEIASSFHEAIMAEARGKFEEIAALYAAAAAVSATTRYGAYETSQFRDVMEVASRSGSLIYGLRRVDVPEEVNAALQNLQGKGRALRIGLITQATI
ncbi:MAG: hypothetical protein J0H88_13840 [Sphingomonadales bacterium]|nr:hypothetical protein [Sphingomonadales bacterium]